MINQTPLPKRIRLLGMLLTIFSYLFLIAFPFFGILGIIKSEETNLWDILPSIGIFISSMLISYSYIKLHRTLKLYMMDFSQRSKFILIYYFCAAITTLIFLFLLAYAPDVSYLIILMLVPIAYIVLTFKYTRAVTK